MPTNYKVIGQSAPSAASNTTLYTVPSSTQAVISTVIVCNTSSSADAFSIAVRPAGETLANKHYIFNGEPIGGNSSFIATVGMTLATTDVVTVFSSNGTSSFNAYGSELS
jgi:hypothetical protein